jgi:DNA polymerase-3 subunit delta
MHNKTAKLYLFAGDEPVLIEESLAPIILDYQQKGFEKISPVTIDGHFKPLPFFEACHAQDLFGSQKIFTLEFQSDKPNKALVEALLAYVEKPSPQSVLILRFPKLSMAAQKSAWFLALQKKIPVRLFRALDRQGFSAWLKQKIKESGLLIDNDALMLLAEYTEGNLFRAKQSLNFLKVAYTTEKITLNHIQEAFQSAPEFTLFEWIDAVLTCDTSRAIKMFEALVFDQVEPILMLWTLAKEIRTCMEIHYHLEDKKSIDAAMEAVGVWKNRQIFLRKNVSTHSLKTYEALLQECALIDKAIKGLEPQAPLLMIERVMLKLL